METMEKGRERRASRKVDRNVVVVKEQRLVGGRGLDGFFFFFFIQHKIAAVVGVSKVDSGPPTPSVFEV